MVSVKAIIAAALFTVFTVASEPADTTQPTGPEININTGQTVDVKSDGLFGAVQDYESSTTLDKITTSNSQFTAAELTAKTEYRNVKNTLLDIIGSTDLIYAGTNGSDMVYFGFTEISPEQLESIKNSYNIFQGVVGLDRVYSKYDSQESIGNAGVPHRKPTEAADIDDSLREQIYQGIIAKEEIETSDTVQSRKHEIAGSDAYVWYSPESPYLTVYSDWLEAYKNNLYLTGMTGVRTDLVFGGLNDALTWTERIGKTLAFYSNTMTDIHDLCYLIDYRIISCKENYISEVSYNSDIRTWIVYDMNGNEISRAVTETPEHTFRFTGDQAGKYRIVAYQNADYTIETRAEYEVYEYLFEPETKNILYFYEKTINNGKNEAIVLSSETYTDSFYPTGDEVYITVNSLGQVTSNSSSVERIE